MTFRRILNRIRLIERTKSVGITFKTFEGDTHHRDGNPKHFCATISNPFLRDAKLRDALNILLENNNNSRSTSGHFAYSNNRIPVSARLLPSATRGRTGWQLTRNLFACRPSSSPKYIDSTFDEKPWRFTLANS